MLRLIERLRRLSLTTRLLAAFLLLVAVSVVTTGAVQAYFSYRDSKSGLFRLQEEKANALAGSLKDFFEAERQRLRGVGPGPTLTDKQLTAQLDSLLTAPQTMSAYYYDSRGRVRAQTALSYLPNIAKCGAPLRTLELLLDRDRL